MSAEQKDAFNSNRKPSAVRSCYFPTTRTWKVSGKAGGAASLLAFLGCGRGPELGGQQIYAVQLLVDRHGLRALLCGHGIHSFVFPVHLLDDA